MAEEKTSGEQLRREKSEFEVMLASALAGMRPSNPLTYTSK
jgi:hypothetical protein